MIRTKDKFINFTVEQIQEEYIGNWVYYDVVPVYPKKETDFKQRLKKATDEKNSN